MHKVLFEFLAFKHPRLLLVSPSDTSTGGGLLGVKFLASENWCGRVHFGGHSPEWRVLAKFSVQPCKCRPAVNDGNLPVNADNPLCSELFAKLLKQDTSSAVADSSTCSTMESSRNQSATRLFTLHIRL